MTYYIYILSNNNNWVLYIWVTNDLIRRVCEHKTGITEGFTSKYQVKKLVYYECFSDIKDAIEREKELKKWHRKWKEDLINKSNSDWSDLYDKIIS